MKKVIISLIRGYQKTSPIRKSITSNFLHIDRSCRFYPTCSDYAIHAIKKYGAARGVWQGFKRFLRCHPWSSGGFDPV